MRRRHREKFVGQILPDHRFPERPRVKAPLSHTMRSCETPTRCRAGHPETKKGCNR